MFPRSIVKSVCLVLLVMSVSLGGTASIASAQTDGQPIVDYDGYPVANGIVPEGCTAQGEALLEGEMFSINGGDPVANLRSAPVALGDTVTMTWDSIAAGCESSTITLSMKVTNFPVFEISDNQHNVLAASCTGPACAALNNTLTIDMLGEGNGFSCFQLDAHLGAPLNVVGPEGNYYGGLNGVHNVLIAAKNGGQTPCQLVSCDIAGVNAPAISAECQAAGSGISFETSTTTTTEAPAAVLADAVEVTTTVAPTTPPATLPRTGAEPATLAWIGWIAMLAGGLLVFGRRLSNA